jgi:hypothetical protein
MESISKLSERDQWINIKNNFKSYAVDEFWEQGFRLFRNRINNKFIAPLDKIIELKNHVGEGFAILIVQCALIETFAAFKYGKVFNPRYNEENDPTYQYRDSRKIFTDFLHEEKIFENHFFVMENDSKIMDKPFVADDFYSNVRCALVHEGRTRKKWTINVKPKKISDSIFIKEIGGKHKIYRTFLQRSLKQYLNDYLNDLHKNHNEELRKFFGRKMDHIYHLKKNNLNWWNEN